MASNSDAAKHHRARQRAPRGFAYRPQERTVDGVRYQVDADGKVYQLTSWRRVETGKPGYSYVTSTRRRVTNIRTIAAVYARLRATGSPRKEAA